MVSGLASGRPLAGGPPTAARRPDLGQQICAVFRATRRGWSSLRQIEPGLLAFAPLQVLHRPCRAQDDRGQREE